MKKLLVLLLSIMLLFGAEPVLSQGLPVIRHTLTFQKTPLKTVIADLEQKYKVKVFFREEWVSGQLVTLNLPNATLPDALNAALAGTDYRFEQYDAGNLVLLPAGEIGLVNAPNAPAGTSEIAGKNVFDPKAQLIGGTFMAPRGQKLTLMGTVTDAKRNEPVVGGRVTIESLGIGAITDLEGNYQLKVEAGKYEVMVSALGLESVRKLIQLNGSGSLNVVLPERAVGLKEVQVEAVRRDLNVSGTQMGVNKLSMREISKMPALLGEVDVVKSVQMLPGVTSVGEASAGFNVRGGNTDQNLILLDDVPVFNPTHLFGFFSVFNPDAVQDVTLYRGAIPAQMGGRLSSILDVRQKEGNYKKFQGTGGIGLVSARLALEGPVMKDKGSILVAGRTSYSNWIFGKLHQASLRDDRASFYDATIKLSATLSDKSKYIFSGYRSHDSFQFNADTVYSWNTTNCSLTFNHLFSEKLEGNFTGIYGDYDLFLDFNRPLNEARYSSGINQKGVKADFTYRFLKQTLRFGGSSIYFDFSPGALNPKTVQSNVIPVKLPQDRAIESALYVNDELEINSRLALTMGLRFSAYQNLGPGPVFQYQEGRPRSLQTLTDTVFYAENDLVKPYQGLEPRFSARFNLTENTSLKAGYSRTRQYLHVISNTLTISPIDIWKTSNRYIKPQVGDQVALGLFRNLQQNTIETSVEVYYKNIRNQIDYKDGAMLFLNQALETELLPVNGHAYGFEFMLARKAGHFTGWVSYAYSRTFLQTQGLFPEEKINNNEIYSASYDKPHILNLVTNIQLNRRVSFSTNFNYSSGRPFTAAVSHYAIDGNVVPFFGPRNAYRLPAYHRLDLALIVQTNHKKNKKWEGNWSFGVYNVYARQNVYSAFYRHTFGSKAQAYRLSVIGSAIPSITYNFKF